MTATVVALNEGGERFLAEIAAMEEQRAIVRSNETGDWLLALAERDERAGKKPVADIVHWPLWPWGLG